MHTATIARFRATARIGASSKTNVNHLPTGRKLGILDHGLQHSSSEGLRYGQRGWHLYCQG